MMHLANLEEMDLDRLIETQPKEKPKEKLSDKNRTMLANEIPSVLDLLAKDEYITDPRILACIGKPVGQATDELLEAERKKPKRTALKELYEADRCLVKDPLDYVRTVPDKEVRWKI
jgi:hypothetical protein